MFERQLFTLLIVIFSIFYNLNHVYALCCTEDIIVNFACHIKDTNVPNSIFSGWSDGKWSCRVHICKDGTTISPLGYCGVGGCNFFGCNCSDGCKTNVDDSKEEALRLFKEKYHVEEAVHGRWVFRKIEELKDKFTG